MGNFTLGYALGILLMLIIAESAAYNDRAHLAYVYDQLANDMAINYELCKGD